MPMTLPSVSDDDAAEPVRIFASAGTLSAEHDLAERVEDVLHTEA
jgi:hypothetical protein